MLSLADCGAMRVLLDLSMVLNHAPVAAFLLSDEERFARLLKGLRAYQETFPWVRMTREHAAFESTMWRYASCIEVIILDSSLHTPPALPVWSPLRVGLLRGSTRACNGGTFLLMVAFFISHVSNLDLAVWVMHGAARRKCLVLCRFFMCL